MTDEQHEPEAWDWPPRHGRRHEGFIRRGTVYLRPMPRRPLGQRIVEGYLNAAWFVVKGIVWVAAFAFVFASAWLFTRIMIHAAGG